MGIGNKSNIVLETAGYGNKGNFRQERAGK